MYFFKKDLATIRNGIKPTGFATPALRIPTRKGKTQVVANPPPPEPIFDDLGDMQPVVGAVDIADDLPLEAQVETPE